ncbi:hypothetical protein [Allomesorhizobium camelthorni]|uniref:Uncharacterized protein n=1 Tax=Allomesorhizobium camelthorni TaxID=475069 RepID=A0A6G4W6M2_9HYPH|nr:hypothetical protein [Mesorhizobium camelthorni]NGO50401.1 hypothetical protein [Mesorhizobium camelthorni]
MDAGYQNTISGLLRKRGEMLANMADLREQIAVASHDQEAHGSPALPRLRLGAFAT